MLGEVRDEIKLSDEIWRRSDIVRLREQQEIDFGLWGPYEFVMPEAEGEWRSETTNAYKMLGNKLIGLLSSSSLQLFIDIDDETRAKRKNITTTERFAIGCIALADRLIENSPSLKNLQSSLAWHACIRGGTAKSVLLTERDGKLRPKVTVYDPMYCQWVEYEEGLLWFCYRDYMLEGVFKKRYSKQIKDGLRYLPDSYGRILLYTFFDEDEWKVAVDGEYLDGERHALGYVPIKISSCGSAPVVRSERYSNTLNSSWYSIYTNDRGIAELESRLLSIGSSIAIESGKVKIFGEVDTSLDPQGKFKEELEKAGYSGNKNRTQVILADKASGSSFRAIIPPPTMEAVERFLIRVVGMRIAGSIDPVTYGQMAQQGSGVLAAELRASSLEFLHPFRNRMELDFRWIAEECVRQFVNSSIPKAELEGKDAKKSSFILEAVPKDVHEYRFSCNLVADRLRDEIQEVGVAIQKVQYGLSSRRTAMLKGNIAEDPDKELDIMDEEFAKKDPVYLHNKLAIQFKKEGDKQMALYHEALAIISIADAVEMARKRGLLPEEAAAPPPPTISPQMQAGGIAAAPRIEYGAGQMPREEEV